MNRPHFARNDWIQKTRFHELEDSKVLHLIHDEMRARLKSDPDKPPVILLDLDSTLYEVHHRTFHIVRDWLQTAESRSFRETLEKLQHLKALDVGYSLRDTFHAMGLDLNSSETLRAFEALKRFWSSRFFSNHYLHRDQPYPGAVDFVKKLYDSGAVIVYLTGRDAPGMSEGTQSNLLRDEFPYEVERTHLILKPRADISDIEHKVKAMDQIETLGSLVASFENEPKNLVAIYERFPDSIHVFVDTIYSDHPAPPAQGIYRISGFKTS